MNGTLKIFADNSYASELASLSSDMSGGDVYGLDEMTPLPTPTFSISGAGVIDSPAALGDVPAPAMITVAGVASPGPFSPIFSDTDADLFGISGYDANNIFAVGENGEILVWNGVAWTAQTSGITDQLNGVYVLNSTHIYAVGDNGATVFSDDGATWADQHPMNVELLTNPGFETWPTGWQWLGGHDSYLGAAEAVPHSGTHCLCAHMEPGHSTAERIILSSVGGAVKPGSRYELSTYYKTNSGSYAGRLYAFFYNAGGTSILQTEVSSNWASPSYQQLLGAITAPSSAASLELRLYVDNNGTGNTDEFLCIIDDASLKEVSAPDLNAVSAVPADPTHVWAVGADGDIRFSANSSTWVYQASGHTHDLYGVAAVAANNVYAVGEEGCIAHYNGGAWSHVHVGTHTFHAIYAFDATHIWVVGDAGIIYFSANGTTWTQQISGVSNNLLGRRSSTTTGGLYGVWGYGASNVYAAGDNGVILGFDGTIWKVISGNNPPVALYGVYALATEQVWAAGDGGGTILQGIDAVTVMPMTNLIIGQRDAFASDFAPVQDAAGATQVPDANRHGGDYRSLVVADGPHKFRYPVGSHAGRYILSIGTSWAASTTYDQLSIGLYLETADGVKISATDITVPALDLGNPTTKFKETAFQDTRLADITIPSHYVSPNANMDNIYQVIEVTNTDPTNAEWLDCCTLIPVDRCVELSDMAANFVVFDSEEGMVLKSQLGSVDTAAVYNPASTVDSPRFVVSPSGTQLVVLAGNIASGDAQLTPILNITISYEPQYWLVPE